MNYFEFYPGDYSRDTRHCSLAEHGAFLLLLSAYYATEKPLPADYVALYRMCSAMSPEEQAAVRSVADAFFPVADDGLRHNSRADREIPKALARIDKARSNGKLGGRPPKKEPSENPAGFDPVNPDETQRVSGMEPSGHPSGKAPHTPYTNQEKEQKRKGGRAAPIELPDWLPADDWEQWHRFRNGRKGWTAHAKALSLRSLTKLRDDGHDPRAVIEQSIERGWTGLFPVKPSHNGAPHGTHDPRSSRPSLVERVAANARRIIAAERAAIGLDDGDPVAADGADLRAPLDGTARRIP